MASRRRSSQVQWTGDQRDASLNGMFESMVSSAKHSLGRDDVSIGTEADANLVGLPLPALCLRYLFQSTTFPLSRITQITGQEGSAKSAFLYEIFRWHMTYGGGAVLAENENKDSPELRHSLLQWNPTWLSRLVVQPSYSMEQWQDIFTTYIGIARDQQDHKDGPGRTVPIALGVDSIMATAPQDEIDQVLKEGHSKRGYALAANLIARYMRTMPERIKNYPFSVLGTNHLKPGTDARGLPTRNVPGGKAVPFMETYEIEMAQDANKDIDKLEYGGLRVTMTARKNSLGPSRKRIRAELLWWYANDGSGMYRQQTAWDWDTATIELLLSFELAKGKKTIYNALMDICDIRVVRKSSREAWSRTLGLGSSGSPVHYRVLGAALEQRPDLLNQIYQLLGIAPRRPFQPGVDYRDLLETAREEATAQAQDLYKDVENLPQLGSEDLGEDAGFDPEAEPDPEEEMAEVED